MADKDSDNGGWEEYDEYFEDDHDGDEGDDESECPDYYDEYMNNIGGGDYEEEEEDMGDGEDRLCDFCHKREASLFIDQVGGDGSRKIKVCMDCAIARGFSPDPDNLRESMTEFINNVERERREAEEDKRRCCPTCGRSLGDVKLCGTFGCADCYSAFKEHIDSIMERVCHPYRNNFPDEDKKGQSGGKSYAYAGILPRRGTGENATANGGQGMLVNDRMDLLNKEQEAVRNEDYEKAAFYRDCIRSMGRGVHIAADSCTHGNDKE